MYVLFCLSILVYTNLNLWVQAGRHRITRLARRGCGGAGVDLDHYYATLAMNGVRRFLGAATASPPPASEDAPVVPPLVPRNGPSWPPNNAGSPDSSPYTSPKMNTAALFLRKDKQKAPPPPPLPNDDDSPGSSARTSGVSSMMTSQGQTSATSSPSRPSMSLDKSTPIPGSSRPEWKRSSTLVNLRDELLVSLLASEAAIDSRDFEILSSEEVEDLKKVRDWQRV